MNGSVPTITKMFRRALLLSCPRCGGRPCTMRRWLGHRERCPRCGIRWHREHGFELGPIALNVIVTFALLAIGMVVAFVATAPDFPVLALSLSFVGGAIIIPLLAYPFTFLIWQAVDLQLHKPGQPELDEAREFVSAGPVEAR